MNLLTAIKKSKKTPLQFKIQVVSFLLIFIVLFILFISQKIQNYSSIITMEFNDSKEANEVFSNFFGEEKIISPYNIIVPFSNFHDINNQTLITVLDKLIDNDIRNSILIEKLSNFFFFEKHNSKFVIRVICNSKAAEKKLITNLQNKKIYFSKTIVQASQQNIWITLLLLVVITFIVLNIRIHYIRKLLILLLLPWLIFMMISLSISFAIIVLLLEIVILNLINQKPDFFMHTHEITISKIIQLVFYCILCMLLLAFSDWLTLGYFIICCILSYAIYRQWLQKQKNKEHKIPIFMKIVPNTPSWMITNKIMMLTAMAIIFLVSFIYSGSDVALLNISNQDIENHLEKQYESVQGSVYNAQSKPNVIWHNEQPTVTLIDPRSSPHKKLYKNEESKFFISSLLALKISKPFFTRYALTTFIILFFIALLDFLFSAGKKIKKLIYFKSSFKTLPDGMNITITDASI